MRIDPSPFAVVAICETCPYRTIRPTPAKAWTALAQHAKDAHGDARAVARARDAAFQMRKRTAARGDA